MFSEMKSAILITIVFTVLTGLLYPLGVTGLAQTMFHKQANGSLIEHPQRFPDARRVSQKNLEASTGLQGLLLLDLTQQAVRVRP